MRKRALLIGINQYHLLGQLDFAVADAAAFADALTEHFGFSDLDVTRMSCDGEGRMCGLSRYIEHALDDLRQCRDLDLLVFGFWGHGLSPHPGQRYLCGVDTLETDPVRTAVSMGVVKDKLVQVQAENTLLVFDCCQNRPNGRSASAESMTDGEEAALASMARDIQASQALHSKVVIPTVAVLNACREGQKAYEWKSRGHGVFTAHLLDGLQQGFDGIASLAAWTAERIARTAMEVHGQEQIPYVTIEGRGDIPFKMSCPAPRPAAPVRPKPSPAETETVVAMAVGGSPAVVVDPHSPAGWLARANSAAHQISYSDEAKTEVYCLIALASHRSGDANAAKLALTQATAIATKLHPKRTKAVVCCGIATTQARVGDSAAARRSFNKAQAADLDDDVHSYQSGRADTFKKIAAAQARAGDIEGARAAADAIQGAHDAAQAYAAIALAQGRSGDGVGAQESFARARTLAKVGKYSFERVEAYGAIAEAETNAGDATGARQSFSHAKNIADSLDPWDTFRSSAYCELAEALARSGNVSDAQAAIASICDHHKKVYAYHEIVAAQAKIRDIAGANATADKIFDSFGKARAYQVIAEAQAASGDVAGAKVTLSAITEKHAGSGSRSTVASAQARSGDVAGAKATVVGIVYSPHKATAYRSIAEAQTRAGDRAGVELWIESLADNALELAYACLGAAEGMLPPKGEAFRTR